MHRDRAAGRGSRADAAMGAARSAPVNGYPHGRARDPAAHNRGGAEPSQRVVYNKAVYEREKRQALDMWGAHVTALAEGRSSNVAPLIRTP
jgi:hypothetical protein